MAIRFLLLENGFGENTFQSLLKIIQGGFGFFTAILNHFYPSFSQHIPQLQQWIDPTSSDTVSHSFARCYATRSIIDELFGISKWYNYSHFSPDDMSFRIISIGGPVFPDHTFVLINVRGENFLLQSYYYAYLLSGKYGVLQLDAVSLAELNDILESYKAIANGEVYISYDLLSALRLRLAVFTGIDSSRSVGNIAGAALWGGRLAGNYINDDITFANSQVVFEHFKQKLVLFDQTVRTVVPVTPEELRDRSFNIIFNYHFSDAFIPDAYVNVGGIQALPDHMRSDVFHILVGTEQPPGVALGIEHGPVGGGVLPYFVSRKTIRVPVEEIYRLFDIIRRKLDLLQIQSEQHNNVLLSLTFDRIGLETTILLDETQQALKLERARYTVAHFPQYRR